MPTNKQPRQPISNIKMHSKKYDARNSQNIEPTTNGPQLDFGLSGYSKPINNKGGMG